jgi:hypothetical protein
MLEITNEEYRQKVESAMIKALFDASIIEHDGQRTAALLSGEIVAACLNMIAMVTAGSSVTGSPTKNRIFCDDLAKRLRKRMAEVDELRAKGELDWFNVMNAEDRH